MNRVSSRANQSCYCEPCLLQSTPLAGTCHLCLGSGDRDSARLQTGSSSSSSPCSTPRWGTWGEHCSVVWLHMLAPSTVLPSYSSCSRTLCVFGCRVSFLFLCEKSSHSGCRTLHCRTRVFIIYFTCNYCIVCMLFSF